MEPPDLAARVAIRERLDETLFVEAGAGSGKTTCLVDRFVALVESGTRADRIAAITFTEKAAGELADRIRTRLQERARDSSLCAAALEDLDGAAIGTLHSFAQRLLVENPIEAGLPPRFSVLDDIGSDIDFASRWDAFLDRMLEDPALERPLSLLVASGGTTRDLRQVAEQFQENWDLVASGWTGHRTAVPPLEPDLVLAAAERVVRMGGQCRDESDGLLRVLEDLGRWLEEARAAYSAGDEDTVLALLAEQGKSVSKTGRAANWPDIAGVRAAVAELLSRRKALSQRVEEGCLQRVAEEIADFTVRSAAERRAEGRLDFHDLLVLARALLRDPAHGTSVRRRLHERYQRLLLDEFQDTDPIQVELAVLIASTDPEAGAKPWHEVGTEPGHLFFVGDPKQSIYRFRRADIAMFLQARAALAEHVEELTANFRSVSPVVEWVNHTFDQLIVASPGSQPAYIPLSAARSAPGRGPGVGMVGLEAHPSSWRADDLREAEAASVVAAIVEAVASGWTVEDRLGERPARWSDVAILLPARTSLPALERALEGAGVPYRAETSSLVYGTAEVRDLLMVARAVEDPTDSLAVVAALRTSMFGCGDDDLYDWRHTYRGWWDHQAPRPDGAPADHPVRDGLDWMGGLHRERLWLSPSEVLDRIVRERRLMEMAFVHTRPRDLWRRIRFVMDHCRAWEEAGGASLRGYLEWVKLQSAEGARVIERVLPETDDEAVRILTIHGAKGLEFPITVLSGMTTQMAGVHRGVQVLFPAGVRWAIHLKEGLETAEFVATKPIEEQMDVHERLRLLYVGATRARDHLVVSVHRKEKRPNSSARPTSADKLHDAGWNAELVVPVAPKGPVEGPLVLAVAESRAGGSAAAVEVPTLASWQAWRDAVVGRASLPVAVSATRLAEEAARAAQAETLEGMRKDGRDIDLPPWQRGRYGSAVGRAVHGVLQSVDLATGAGLEAECRSQAAAEGIPGKEDVIEALCRSALVSDVVRAAAAGAHWREVYVGVRDDGHVLEGYVDLLYRREGGLVIVDYKTDSWRLEDELSDKVVRYRPQLEAYRRAVEGATRERVVATKLLFLREGAAVERDALVPLAAPGAGGQGRLF